MVRELKYDSEEYNKRSVEFLITAEELKIPELLQDLTDTIISLDRPYLCANEIGVDLRALVVKFGDTIKEFLNPIAQAKQKPKLVRELSYDDNKEYIIPRYTEMVIAYLDKDGKEITCKLTEDAAILFSQVFDKLNGLHDSDYGLEIIPEFDSATDEEREDLLKQYIKELSEMEAKLDSELASDEETKSWWTGYKFNKAVAEGKIETEADSPKMNRKERRLLQKISKKLGGKK